MKNPRTHADSAHDDPTIEHNIRLIAELEEKALATRSLGEKIGDAASRAHRLDAVRALPPRVVRGMDRPQPGAIPGSSRSTSSPSACSPWSVSLEAIFLSLFLLISQNRMTRQADKRAHLDLQINLLAEAETTKILRCSSRSPDKVGVPKEERPAAGSRPDDGHRRAGDSRREAHPRIS
jgi:hypothetical protein